MNRTEAVIFARASVVPLDILQKVVGKAANIYLLIEDIQVVLKCIPYEIVSIGYGVFGGLMFRARLHYATAIRTAADIGKKQPHFSEDEMAVLCAVAYHQPIDRAGLAEIFWQGDQSRSDWASSL